MWCVCAAPAASGLLLCWVDAAAARPSCSAGCCSSLLLLLRRIDSASLRRRFMDGGWWKNKKKEYFYLVLHNYLFYWISHISTVVDMGDSEESAKIPFSMWRAALLITCQSFLFGYCFSCLNSCLVTGDKNSASDCYHGDDSTCPKGTIYNDMQLSTSKRFIPPISKSYMIKNS